MPDTLITPASLMLHNADRHYPTCQWSRLDPATHPCTCGLAEEIREIEAAHIDAMTAAVERVEKAYDGINGWHDVTYENVTEALYALLALTREHR